MCEDSELGKFVFNENHRYILHNERSKKKINDVFNMDHHMKTERVLI